VAAPFYSLNLEGTAPLEVEALVNTFLVYTPMQLAAGRQRPSEGNGYGDFGHHHNIDTSFPAGHPMFTIAMASVVPHEYPKPWVEALAYGAAAAVMGGPLLGRDHCFARIRRLSAWLFHWIAYLPFTLQSNIQSSLSFPIALVALSRRASRQQTKRFRRC